ncbi:hypothetical protein L873DRAFT_1730369 [Choiromyces venosus 120613-1]|uniref:Uncharacterized protein n=1 Tax=Choiromyces venosus 120613-1 TaxID=1336337 RepID=A0A3N4K086_9PEZI|nr:hypothetical protein L873DRAFT_1730369 [Choiromyces venosus 120613-1]
MHFKFLLLGILPAATVFAQTCTIKSGRRGECIKTTACSSNRGKSEAGHCPGDSTIQCCTYGACTNTAGNSGFCQPTSTCSGTTRAGRCPGPAHIQCCTTTGKLPGLNSVQSTRARQVMAAARAQGVGMRGCQVGIVTGMQESNMRVLANKHVHQSMNYPHDGIGSDHDAVGIFQQRPQFWGTVRGCMDPSASSQKFFVALKKVSGWQSMTIGKAAQSVQRSAHSDAYDKWVSLATNVCNAGF